jgi:uncharacterized protein (DUF2252 family)
VPAESVEGRFAWGRSKRADVPRSSHGEWRPAQDRPDPVELLEQQAATRVPELVPIRYSRMLVSPFTFYRGAAYLMASDLAGTPRTGLEAQLCGDAHLSNFGAYAAPDRRLVFSINDFDETLPGPFEWDLKRLVTSFAVAGRDRGFSTKQRRAITLAVSRSYREAIGEMATMRTMDVWYARLNVDTIQAELSSKVSTSQRKRFERNVAKAQAKDSLKALKKLVRRVDGRPRLIADPPLIVPIEDLLPDLEALELHSTMQGLIHSYRRTLQGDHRRLLDRYRYVDAARKVVGVGSVGTRAWILLMMGRDDEDPLFLQAKEAQTSVLEPFLGKSRYAHHGQRVVEGQRLMQAASDIMLGWVSASGVDGVSRDFFIRQLWDGKGSALVDVLEPSVMATYAGVCGWTLARAHSRSGDAPGIAGYLGNGPAFDEALASFAEAYADQNDADHAALKRAVEAGRVRADAGL